MSISIEEIKTTVDLLKKANNSSFATIPELAREIKSTKTKVMLFIEENPKLFALSQRWKPRKKTVTKVMFGNKYKEEVTVRGASLGLCIDNAYLQPSDNFRTQEWLEKTIQEKKKYLHISEFDNYGHIQGYHINIDSSKDDEYRRYAWRNTKEKVFSLKEKGLLFSTSSVMGGFGDSYTVKSDYGISPKTIEKLKKEGWTFNEYKPLSQ